MKNYKIKWTKERCAEEALKYETKGEFSKKSASAYNRANFKGFLNEICQHMKIIGNLYKRCIYAAEFDNNFVYIGLTYSFNKRINEHLTDKKSKVFKHIKETNIFPEFKKLTDYIDNLKAKEYEEYYLNNYKNNNWNILNVAKTGALGGFLD